MNSAQIAVVIQGPVAGDGLTRRCLESLRAALPEAALILSTWEGSDTAGLDFDELVLSADPGPARMELPTGTTATNLPRQIVSTQAGLRLVDRPFTLKFRTDAVLRSAGFLEYFGRYGGGEDTWQIFVERVVILDHFSRNPRRGPPRLFHPSDMVGFGRTEDVRRWWEVPLPEAILVLPEQYVWLASVRNKQAISLPTWDYDDTALQAISEHALARNFVIVRRGQFGVELPRHRLNLGEWGTLYTHSDWYELYRRYGGVAEIAGRDWAALVKDLCYPRGRAQEGWRRGLRWVGVRWPAVATRL